MLPDYIAKASPNPPSQRSPWYTNTAPSYAGVFLWVAFYQSLAVGAIDRAGLGLCVLALLIAGVLSYKLYYYAPAMLGMKTGLPLYVVGSSTFGALGGYLMPGLLMGALQIGWFAVGAFFATKFILTGLGLNAAPATFAFAVVAILWGYSMAYIGAMGIQYVSKVALYLNGIAFLMVLVVFLKTAGGLSQHTVNVEKAAPFAAFTLLIQAVVGFFATAGAAGADFGMNSRNQRDVRLGGLVGITLAILYAGTLPVLSVAGARATNPQLTGLTYDAAIASVGGVLASAMFLLFAVTSIPSACFCPPSCTAFLQALSSTLCWRNSAWSPLRRIRPSFGQRKRRARSSPGKFHPRNCARSDRGIFGRQRHSAALLLIKFIQAVTFLLFQFTGEKNDARRNADERAVSAVDWDRRPDLLQKGRPRRARLIIPR